MFEGSLKGSDFLNVVLFEPEIPQNTGNVVRLCACLSAKLFLVGKLGFVLTDKHLKRSGLDYWDKVEVVHAQTLEELIENNPQADFYYFTTKTDRVYTKRKYKKGDFLVFGPETRGIPEDILDKNIDFCLTIPMQSETRSLNLSNSVAIAAYEAFRQFDCDI